MRMQESTRAASPKCVCASEHAKLIGAIDGTFPDFGHHQEREMGGLWMHPIKVLDGFWLRFCDHDAENVDTWIQADQYTCLPYGNEFLYGSGLGHTPVTICRKQLAPKSAPGVIISYGFTNRGQAVRHVSVEFLAKTDLLPVWFSGEQGIVAGERDIGWWEQGKQHFIAKDEANPWYAAIGCSVSPREVLVGDRPGPRTAGNGTDVSILYDLELQPGAQQELHFFITGSSQSQAECEARLWALQDGTDFFAEKQRHVGTILQRSRLTVPDQRFAEVYDWVKVHTDWLIIDAGQYGRGLAAGLPEYPWWFGCDNSYALQGVLAMGDFELCRDTLLLLAGYSEKVNGNGRIPHEITTFGICANPGNTQETAHFVAMVWHYYEWTGDKELIKRLMPLLDRSMEWLRAQDEDGDLFPSGYGIIEIEGLHAEMIDTAVYTCQAYGGYATLCAVLGRASEAASARELEKRTRDAINTALWDREQGLYCDTCTSPEFVRNQREAILGQASPHQLERLHAFVDALLEEKERQGEQESGWLINRNWIINTPMETGIATPEQASAALARMHTSEFIGPYGMYLSALYANSTMTISTGVMAVAQARYGHADRALELLEKMFSSFGMASPGTLAEMSPDYGCFVQAWTVYAVLVPIIRHFFGVQPSAAEGVLRIVPQMPSAWAHAAIDTVRVLDGELCLRYERLSRGYRLDVDFTGKQPVEVCVPKGHSVEIDGVHCAKAGETWRVRCPQLPCTIQVQV